MLLACVRAAPSLRDGLAALLALPRACLSCLFADSYITNVDFAAVLIIWADLFMVLFVLSVRLYPGLWTHREVWVSW